MTEIPRILHQIWLGPRRRPTRLLESVRRMHGDWDYRLWTDDNLPAMRKGDAFQRSRTWHQKSDVLRYEVLWKFGGVYVDADNLALRPLDPLMQAVEMFAAYERGGSTLLATGVIGCVADHPNVDGSSGTSTSIAPDRPGKSPGRSTSPARSRSMEWT